MVRFSASLVMVGVLMGGCRPEPKSPKTSMQPPETDETRTFAVPRVSPILKAEELAKPSAPLALSPENLESYLTRAIKRMRGDGGNEEARSQAACFFGGINWQGDDHEMRAEGEAESNGCVVKNEQGVAITYRATKAQVSIVLSCETGGLTRLIASGAQLTDMNPAIPSCVGGRGAIFFQTRLTGEAELPADSGPRVVSFVSLSARGKDEASPCMSTRVEKRVTIEDGCQDIASFHAKDADQESSYFHHFQYHRVAGDAESSVFDEGRLAAQVNDWDGEVPFTTEGTWYNMRRGDEERHGQLP